MGDRGRCVNGGGTHAWMSTGLDVNAAGVLCSTRRCVWCQAEQEKSYGAGGGKPWRQAKKATSGSADGVSSVVVLEVEAGWRRVQPVDGEGLPSAPSEWVRT